MVHKPTLLCCLLFLLLVAMTTAASDVIQSSRRATPDVRQEYVKTATQRYTNRLAERPAPQPTPTSLPDAPTSTNNKSSVLAYHNKRREANLEYHLTGEDKSLLKSMTPREQYIREWNKLPSQQQQAMTKKQDELLSLYTSGAQEWVTFSSQDFVKYALTGSRPYWLWVTFTALDRSIHCPTCLTYHGYWQALTPSLQAQTIAAKKAGEEPLPLIMAIVEPAHARELWRALNLNRAPVSILLQPEFNENTKIQLGNVLTSGVLRQTMMMNPALEDLVNPLQKNGFSVEIPKPSLSPAKVLGLLIAIVLGLYAVYHFWDYLLKLQTFRGPFIIAVLIFFLYAVSGGGFIKTNKPPMTGHKDGAEIWVSREYSQLLGAEMFVVMLLHFTTALGLFLGVISLIPYGLSQRRAQITTPADYDHVNRAKKNAALLACTEKDLAQAIAAAKTTEEVSKKDKKSSTAAAAAGAAANAIAVDPAEVAAYHVTELDESVRFERRVAYFVTKLIPQELLFTVGFVVWFVGYYALISTFKIKMPSYPFGF